MTIYHFIFTESSTELSKLTIKGEKGEKGEKGDKGITGDRGDKVRTESWGVIWIANNNIHMFNNYFHYQGKDGESIIGPIGPEGPEGLQGPPGRAGDKGQKGVSNFFTKRCSYNDLPT